MPTIIAFVLGILAAVLPAQSQWVDVAGAPIPLDESRTSFVVVDGVPEYRIGPGDQLEVTTRIGLDITTEVVRVVPNGTITLSVTGPIKVAGMGQTEAYATIGAQVRLYIRNPVLQILIQEYRAHQVSVYGAINPSTSNLSGKRLGPGVYPLDRKMTVLDLILEAGGPAPEARLDQSQLVRDSRTYLINLQKAVETGDARHNPVIQDGDVVRVPGITQADRRVAVLGEVGAAGIYSLSRDATVLEAMAVSGGFSRSGAANRVRIVRRSDPRNATILTVNTEGILRGDLSQNVGLQDGDIVVVPRDWLADVGDLLADLQPILAWGGLFRTEPVLSVGGFTVNSGGGGGGATTALPGATVLPSTTTLTEQQIIQQVQGNLQTTSRR